MLAVAIAAICLGVALWVVPERRDAPTKSTRRPGVREVGEKIFLRLGISKPRIQRDEAALIGAALISVAARLRAGQSPTAAWVGALESLPEPIARELDSVAHEGGVGRPHMPALHAAGAATRLAEELGADLAGVLDACAEGIEESTRAQADRDAAFAAPRATAHVLLALPLVGVGVSAIMGARPWVFFTSTWWGILLALMGSGFLLAGRWWIRRLLDRARSVGGDYS